MAKTLKTAVIGLNIGMVHINGYKNCPQAKLAAICDIDADWLAHVAREQSRELPDLKTYTSLDDLLANPDIDVVSVCLPNTLHAEVTMKALKAGKHVLCEKPMALNAASAREMAAAADAAGKSLMICHSRRFLPESQQIKAMVDAGLLGDIYFARAAWRRPMGDFPSPVARRATGIFNRNWFNERKLGGGVLRDLGPHLIDLCLWMMNFPKLESAIGANIAAFTPGLAKKHNYYADAEDFTTGMVRFDNGASLILEASFGTFSEGEEVALDFFGTKGGISLRNSTLKFFGEAAGAYTTVLPRIGPANPPSPQHEFVNAILDGRKPLVTAEQGIQVIQVIDALYESGIRILHSGQK